MRVRLTIDEGNSATKIGLWRGNEMTAVSTHRHASYEIVRDFIPKDTRIDSIIFCSVCGRKEADVLKCLGGLSERVVVLSSSTRLPIEINYQSRKTLGADRIAAAVGAAVVAPGRSVLTVDMGTAITYDFLHEGKVFEGGNIAPGIFVRLEALSRFTKALPSIEPEGDVPVLGYDTETAMRAGAVRGVVAEIEYYRKALAERCAANMTEGGKDSLNENGIVTVITGGSAELIMPLIETPIINEPNLVLIGLNRILDYNETD